MIYEKRYSGEKITTPVAAVKAPTVSVYKTDSVVPYVTPIIKRKNIKRRLKMQKKNEGKGHFLPKALCVVLTLAFVTMTADKYLFHSMLKQNAASALSLALEEIKENTKEKSSAKTQKKQVKNVKSSLYGNAVFDINSEKNPSAAALSENGYLSSNIPTASVSQTDSLPVSADGEKLLPITTLSLAPENLLSVSNETNCKPDIEFLASKTPSSLENLTVTEEPLVLILHTHATECYTRHDNSYPQNEDTRSQSTEENMVSIGKEISKELSAFGISSIHCTKLHDEPSFINAYNESAKTAKEYLKQYPSIRFVIDVHRDAIIRSDGESIRLVNTLAQEDYAQLMFVVGTNSSGHNHPKWKENLSLALHLQQGIEESFPGLCRSINLRNVPFNQNLSDGYLLLEVGTSANTLPQAKNSAKAFARSLAKLILQNSGQQ